MPTIHFPVSVLGLASCLVSSTSFDGEVRVAILPEVQAHLPGKLRAQFFVVRTTGVIDAVVVEPGDESRIEVRDVGPIVEQEGEAVQDMAP